MFARPFLTRGCSTGRGREASKLVRHSEIAILGAPLDLGAGRRGVDMGPSALRLASLNAKLEALGYRVEDLGNIAVAQQESTPTGPENAKYLSQIAKSCLALAQAVQKIATAGRFPLILGGDHSVATGTMAGVSQAFRDRGETVGMIWIDAHSDMNTPETSPAAIYMACRWLAVSATVLAS